MKTFSVFSFELCFWIVAILLLWTSNPNNHHFSLCPLVNLGIDWCPGCGIGRSISWILKGNIKESFNAHWFGVPALIVLICRIITLIRIKYFKIAN
ncbi:DUF2752 domain-containing protein [Pedobacter flavus]|uniref:DUF2752 domain-containing protein n=1 Tax=Pedobacter flavus TaxID=3113906 RepID=A0ABU7H055_9SPHI|nr:DUF2752 domain-containing protein [Pedobacter sp. VNH31]MEE1884408.1 DUF2752 domain-containing protein [Pedobacter sp. VNH31]